MGKISEPHFDGHLIGRFYVDPMSDDPLEQGWILRELNAGLYLVTVFVRIGDAVESVLKVVHPLEMRGWLIFSSYEQARQHYDYPATEALPAVDLKPILETAAQEFVDLVLEQLLRAQSVQRKQELTELLNRLLKQDR